MGKCTSLGNRQMTQYQKLCDVKQNGVVQNCRKYYAAVTRRDAVAGVS